jgi:hypothetical protein
MLQSNLLIADQSGNKPLRADGLEYILYLDDFLDGYLSFFAIGRLLNLCVLANGVAVIPPIGEYTYTLEAVQYADRLKGISKERCESFGKVGNTKVVFHLVYGSPGTCSEGFKGFMHSPIGGSHSVVCGDELLDFAFVAADFPKQRIAVASVLEHVLFGDSVFCNQPI